jgi:prepilin-type N-terminal cleavage/methylation domain-containing protein
MMAHPSLGVRQASGFTLVEVLISITILAVGIMALGSLLGRGARSAGAASSLTYQTAVMAAEAARYDAIPFTALVAGTTCDTTTDPPLPRTRCVTITNINPKLRQVSVVVTPTGNPLLRPDTLIFERSISGDASPPLSTP